ncbi:snRNA-activating protein complex subunit 5 [Mactra antiquata]
MASVQSVIKELRTLKQEEATMINLASKISDQLNRLKVEELALQNMVRLQNEELERRSRASQRSMNRSMMFEDEIDQDMGDNSNNNYDENDVIPLDLQVYNVDDDNIVEEEEEEEDDDENDDDIINIGEQIESPEDIEQFVNSL